MLNYSGFCIIFDIRKVQLSMENQEPRIKKLKVETNKHENYLIDRH